jgi:hypothetical protein
MEQGPDPWESMPWMNHDPVCEHFWPRLKQEYPQFQFLICDDDDDGFSARDGPFHFTGRDVMPSCPTGWTTSCRGRSKHSNVRIAFPHSWRWSIRIRDRED